MDIVLSPKLSREKADEMAIKLLPIILAESKSFNTEDDPSEHVYLLIHALSNLTARIIISLENYAKIYGIHDMTSKTVEDWIVAITKEYVSAYKEENRNG